MPTVSDLSGIRRVLVIKLRAIGDVILSTVVTGNLRRAFPEAAIDFLTEPPSREVLSGNRFINSVVLYDRRAMNGLDLIRTVRRGRYDLIIDLFGNPRTALLTRLSGARLRVGYRFRGRAYAYNVVVEPRGNRVHNTQFNLDALEALGIAITDRSIYFPFSIEDERFVDAFFPKFADRRPLVVSINAGGGWYTKRWGLDRYASLADRLVDEYRAHIILLWGPGERGDVESIKSMMHHPAFIPPQTTLSQLGALIKKSSIMVTNDSGPMHIAAAVGTPVLGIYGPTDPVLQGPYGDAHVVIRNESLSCLGCNYTSCPIGHPCMLELPVESVSAGVRTLLVKNGLWR